MRGPLCIGNVQSTGVRVVAGVAGMRCCLSEVFYAFYLKMHCPRPKAWRRQWQPTPVLLPASQVLALWVSQMCVEFFITIFLPSTGFSSQ